MYCGTAPMQAESCGPQRSGPGQRPRHRGSRHRVGKGPVLVRAGKGQSPGGVHICFCLRCGVADAACGDEAHSVFGVRMAELLRGKAVRIDDILPAGELPFQREFQPRRMLTCPIAHFHDTGRLIEGEPLVDPAFEMFCHFCRVDCKRPGGVLILPAALFFQRLRQIPVIQRNIRLDARFQQSIHKTIVIGKAFFVPVRAAGGGDARPRHREAIGFQVHRLQQFDVFPPAVIAVAGGITGLAPIGAARCVGENIPDTPAFSILDGTALDLIGCSRSAPYKFFWKYCHVRSPFISSDTCVQELEILTDYSILFCGCRCK